MGLLLTIRHKGRRLAPQCRTGARYKGGAKVSRQRFLRFGRWNFVISPRGSCQSRDRRYDLQGPQAKYTG